jgi:serine/threonine-protein kinase
MSSVYAAVHRNGNPVAIKVLSRELTANTRARARFLREGYVANRVGHPGAVRVLDDDIADGEIVFLVMELLDGETLADRARRLGGRLPPNEVAFAADGLLDVLASAHAHGIVHRDVKPANVFLTRRGEVKLLDFGIARLEELSGVPISTRSGGLLGTPGFMAPEQARGRWAEVDARTDLWAVGASMFRLISGRAVHEVGTDNEAVIAAATEPVASLGSLEPGLPARLVRLVDRALCLDPGARWQSALDMQAGLRDVQAALPTFRWEPPPSDEVPASWKQERTQSEVSADLAPSRPAASPATTAAPRPSEPRRRSAWLLALGAGIVVAGGAGLLSQRRSPVAALPPVPRVSGPAPAKVAPREDQDRRRPEPAAAVQAPPKAEHATDDPGARLGRSRREGAPLSKAREPHQSPRPAAPPPKEPAAAAPGLRDLLDQRR